VPPFDESGRNFAHWQYHMKIVLRSRELWKIVKGTDPKPNEDRDPEAYDDWISQDCNAIQQIVMGLNEEAMNHVIWYTTTRECWENLSDRYHSKGEKQVVHLLGDLFHTTLNDSEPIETQVNCLQLSAQSLTTIGFPINYHFLAFLILLTLPDSMDVLKCMLYQVPKEQMNSDHVTTMILDDEKRRI
jgi:gag-polypeptide of LTR copia-type